MRWSSSGSSANRPGCDQIPIFYAAVFVETMAAAKAVFSLNRFVCGEELVIPDACRSIPTSAEAVGFSWPMLRLVSVVHLVHQSLASDPAESFADRIKCQP